MSDSSATRQPRYLSAVRSILNGMTRGSLTLRTPDGQHYRHQGRAPGPHAEIHVLNTDLFARVLRDGNVAFAEAYMDNWFDTPDLQALLDVILSNEDSLAKGLPARFLVRHYENFRHWMNRNSRKGSARNISQHYDLGNEFYSNWLDESMTYSSAIFQSPEESLTQAQTNKYASICDILGVKEGSHLLEVGCGWGGFAEYAAKTRGARVTGLTISQKQFEFARARISNAGLNDRVDIVMRDYRDETGRYDGVASIEMFEAVGEKYWPIYFDMLRNRLRPGGKAALQIITIADQHFSTYRRNVDFIQKYVFPGGMLPSPKALSRAVRGAGMDIVQQSAFGVSYSTTLRAWRKAFNGRWNDISKLGFDERFCRMWNYYLASCASCFEFGATDVMQVGIQKPR